MTVTGLRVLCGVGALALLLSPAFGQSPADWSTQANSLRGQNGARFSFVCPPNGTISSRVWGTDVYTDDSSICSCAVHAGLITAASGGQVSIQIEPGASSYRGSARNGVNSLDYGAWTGSFTFGAATPPPPAHTNLALHKPASQSSVFSGDYPAANCVDGVKGGVNFCHTNNETNPWWQVDLQGSYALSEIVVYNRSSCCAERGRTITALVSTDGQSWNRIYAHDGTVFQTLRIDARGRTARYVRLQLAATDYLNIEEVEVFGLADSGGETTGAVRVSIVNHTGSVKNPHDFLVDFASCSVREYNQEFADGTEDIRVSVCQDKTRFSMRTDFRTTGYWIEYDWLFLQTGGIVAGSYRDPGSCGPSVGTWSQ